MDIDYKKAFEAVLVLLENEQESHSLSILRQKQLSKQVKDLEKKYLVQSYRLGGYISQAKKRQDKDQMKIFNKKGLWI